VKRYLVGKLGFNKLAYLFIFVQIILYVAFLTLDFMGQVYAVSADIKFGVIILCFCYVFFFGKNTDKGIIFCMKAGMFFTLVSDLFLLMLDYYVYGVLTFIVVQQLYSIRLILAEHRKIRKLALRISLQLAVTIGVCMVLGVIGVKPDILLIISVFYFVSIVTNTFTAVWIAVQNHKDQGNVLFAVGMVLFLLCDINVGIFNMSGFVALPEKLYQLLYSLSSVLMWTFYAPAQVILVLSTTLNMAKSTNKL
jgi:hypothetical protein